MILICYKPCGNKSNRFQNKIIIRLRINNLKQQLGTILKQWQTIIHNLNSQTTNRLWLENLRIRGVLSWV